MALKLDLHVHTCYSLDATITPEEVLAYVKKRGLDGVAITDHDAIEGALKLVKRSGLIIIPGVEVSTLRGHVLGLNVTRPIPSGLGLHETIQLIHNAGGIAAAAHPSTFPKRLKGGEASNFDAIEVINASAFPFIPSTYLSRKLALRLNLSQIGGSDAHYAPEIGFAYTLVDADPEVDEVIQAIKNGAAVPLGKPIPLGLRIKRGSWILKRKIRKKTP